MGILSLNSEGPYMPTQKILFLGASVVCLALIACSGSRPSDLGVTRSRLAPCPDTPNCVSSDSLESEHQIKPLLLNMPANKVWEAAAQAVSSLPRTNIVTRTESYLHAECRSRLLGFVDDLELHLRPSEGILAVRSASRLGYSDFQVNRMRVEELRESLTARGLLR